jgi:hypothetical protein
MEAKLKHLEFIQNVITRMANNSFLLKGWAMTIIGALIGLNKDEVDGKIVAIGFFLTFMFWALDAYYLRQERIFRARYDEVRKKEEGEIDFFMWIEGEMTPKLDYVNVFFSVTLWMFYLTLIGSVFLFVYFL